MKLRRRPLPNPAFLYVVPAVDLAMTLIFYLLIGGSILLQPGVAVMPPPSPFILAPQRNPLVVSITSAPLPRIYFENEEIPSTELKAKLASRMDASKTVIVRGDANASYETVMEVVNTALELGYSTVLAAGETP